MKCNTYKIIINGTVQGVGFRPFIYKLASRYALLGTVSNSTQGVEIVVNATLETLQIFLQAIKDELPSLASIEKIITSQIHTQSFADFQIIATDERGIVTVGIPPDVSICKACEKELFDPTNRRYGYPFITCTHCGVRYSIIYDLPYDRNHTSMKFFEMCKVCAEEYNNPLDRRYHAQPIGCWDCGPTLSLHDKNNKPIQTIQKNMINEVARFLEEGMIIAIKGVGGYHLMCDATNDEAVYNLRKRKQRPSKPFAVMVKDIEMANELAQINVQEKEFLLSKERPIVLLKSSSNDDCLPVLSSHIAPNLRRIGLFLPYTPLHLLLLQKFNRPLVATSANVTDEPICTDLKELEKLQGVYDYVLDHNRNIVNGCDDSVVMVVREHKVILRRARGYAPVSIKLPFELTKNVLALGANQKSTIAIGFANEVILSPHIGDLDSISSVEYYKKNIETLERIYHFKPDIIVHDKHPNYESTKYAKSLISYNSMLKVNEVQHHYAHILGVMAEKQLTGKVLGVAFDGTGYGDDGKLWGGEFFVCDFKSYERVAHLNYFQLLGGSKAIKEPRRVALSLLFDLYAEEALTLKNPTIEAFSTLELKTYFLAWKKNLNSPLSSSVGRLFDAVASLLGVCQVMSYEGESGMMLEELYDNRVEGYYPFGYSDGKIDILPVIKAMMSEPFINISVSRFFHTLVEIIFTIYKQYNLTLVLSGGVFQNRILLDLVLQKIPEAVISNNIPPNDGGIALGQIAGTYN
ncbi:carbamoyltransferase HypF [Sulfurovum sp. zt1-1]|uniref:Carbamoyltransferase n=1 Tax=Sulfurovum zhangzhouensis TaxID=3019067 RepID=A0ABT7R0Z0_9BACT|nr:carbamoyltransferase HypF [Sulfurovum zhangzhouensis]MDM5272765.1 carbamoyltransferase HypF [Sulfurovum zhangzhouensis]